MPNDLYVIVFYLSVLLVYQYYILRLNHSNIIIRSTYFENIIKVLKKMCV